MTDIRVPTLGESVTEATIGRWFKKAGDAVAVDEPLVELETDKVTIEVPAPSAGVLSEIVAKEGDTVAVGALLGQLAAGSAATAAAAKPAPAAKSAVVAPIEAPPLAPSVRGGGRARRGPDARSVTGRRRTWRARARPRRPRAGRRPGPGLRGTLRGSRRAPSRSARASSCSTLLAI